MKRLTKKSNNEKSKYVYDNYIWLTEPLNSIVGKLGQLEDIEEELGIDLITFHNLLRCGGYYRNTDKNEIIFDYPHYESDVEQYVLGDIRNFVLLKEEDYGKTWAITKEELE